MAVPLRYVRHQTAVLRGMGEALASSIKQQAGLTRLPAPAVPGPVHRVVIEPRPDELIEAYLRHLGVNPAKYAGEVPPHLFPQWTFPLIGKITRGLRYPMLKVMNGGCRIKINGKLPRGEKLVVTGQLASVDDDGKRAIIDELFMTGTESHPNLLETHMYAFFRLKSSGQKSEKPRVPENAVELARWKLPRQAGLDFAMLTGDFNPVHWVPGWGKAMGMGGTILHGFATFARAMEGLREPVKEIAVRFTRPIVLPRTVGLYVLENKLWVGDAPGSATYLEGDFS